MSVLAVHSAMDWIPTVLPGKQFLVSLLSVCLCIRYDGLPDAHTHCAGCRWHAAGRSLLKSNSLVDLEACLDYLVQQGGPINAPFTPCNAQ